jgi:hypothetical protein
MRQPRLVDVQVVVTPEGTVGAARVIKSLEPVTGWLALVTGRAWTNKACTQLALTVAASS